MTYQYSAAISISPVQGKTLAAANALSNKDGSRFQSFTKTALKILEKSQTGARLINEINASGHTCTIFAGDQLNDNCAKPNPDDIANGLARMIRNFRPLQKNMPQNMKEWKTTSNQKYKDYKANMASLGAQHGLATDQTAAGAILLQIMNRAKVGMGLQRWRNALYACNSSELEIMDFVMGVRKIDDTKYYRLCIEFYDYLQPGPGCNTQVRIQPPAVFKQQNKDLIDQAGKKGVGKMAATLLGHELIHAWRMMTGRRIVDDGWDEEMMTVGLGPCSGWPITENRLRISLGLLYRRNYSMLSRYSSPEMVTLMMKDDQFEEELF